MRKLSTCLTVVMLGFSTAFTQTTFAQSAQTAFAQSDQTALNYKSSNPFLARPVTLPSIIPAPISIELKKGSILLGKSVVLVATPGTGSETVELIKRS